MCLISCKCCLRSIGTLNINGSKHFSVELNSEFSSFPARSDHTTVNVCMKVHQCIEITNQKEPVTRCRVTGTLFAVYPSVTRSYQHCGTKQSTGRSSLSRFIFCAISLLRELKIYRGADKSLARPTSRCFLFDGENISFDASLVIYIYK